jgi:hypothetical protein
MSRKIAAALAGIAAAILLGWWIARLVRPRLSVSVAPEDLRGRAREAAWVVAPYVLAVLLLCPR